MQNKTLKFLVILLAIAFIVPQITFAAWWNPVSWGLWGKIWSWFHKPTQVVCTQDAKLCPDGSYVGREGPKCEFKACPDGQSETGQCTKDSECPGQYKCLNRTCQLDQTTGWKTYTDEIRGFSVKYPPQWTYQKFSCNIDGIAFCPLEGGRSFNCGQTCGMDSPSSPVYLYYSVVKPLSLTEDKYKNIYEKMVNSYLIIDKKIYPKPTVTLKFSPDNISRGGSSTLTWSSLNADYCYASGAPDASFGWFGNVSTSGTKIYNNILSDLHFGLSCVNADGTQEVRTEADISIK